MKIRNSLDSPNTFKKERFIPTPEYLEILAEKRRLHRLFNPKNPGKEEPDEYTEKYRDLRNAIRHGRHTNNFTELKKCLKILDIELKIYKPKLIVHNRLPMKPRKPSVLEMNRLVMLKLGWKPNTSSHKKFIPRPLDESKVRRPEVWSEELHRFIREIPVYIKKEKKLSPFWTNKIAEWKLKHAS